MMRLSAWIMLWLAICPMLLGAPTLITRYVDTDTGNDSTGDGSEGNPWASMSHARTQFLLAGEGGDGNFTTTGDTYPEGICGRLYASGQTPDTVGKVTWDVVTGEHNYMEVIGDGDYTLSYSSADLLVIKTDYIRFHNVHFTLTGSTADGHDIVQVDGIAAGSDIRFIGCSFVGEGGDTRFGQGIHINDSDAVVALNNCLLRNMGTKDGDSGIRVSLGTAYAYNCTIEGSYYGARTSSASGVLVLKNTIVSNSTVAYYEYSGSSLAATYCTGDDDTVLDFDTGTTCTGSVSPTFAGDYQLASTDTTWIDGGIDLSTDDHWHDDDVDYADTSRPQGSAWDIGWHEYESGESEPAPGPITRGFIAPFTFGN